MNLNTRRLTLSLLAVLALATVSLKLFVKEEEPETPAPSEIVSDLTPSGSGSGAGVSGGGEAQPASTEQPSAPVATPAATQPPQQPAQTIQTRPPVTQTPATQRPATPTQTPYVAPTMAPTAPPPTAPPATKAPVITTASGSFSSDTGTFLNLKVDWSTYTDGAGSAKMQIDLSATSYSFNTDAMYNALELSVNGVVYTANSPSIHLTDPKKYVVTPLVSFIIDAPTGGVMLKATWHYKGSYSGIALEDIVASANLFL